MRERWKERENVRNEEKVRLECRKGRGKKKGRKVYSRVRRDDRRKRKGRSEGKERKERVLDV